MKQIFYRFCPVCSSPYSKDIIENAYNKKSYSCSNCQYVLYLNPKPTVGAIIVNENKLLLVKRIWHPFRGFWQLPGGFINYGETPVEALKRELKEELDVEVEVMKLYHIDEDKYQNFISEDCFEIYSFLPITYLARLKGRSIYHMKISDDVAGAKFFDFNQIPFDKIAFSSQKLLIKKFIKEKASLIVNEAEG